MDIFTIAGYSSAHFLNKPGGICRYLNLHCSCQLGGGKKIKKLKFLLVSKGKRKTIYNGSLWCLTPTSCSFARSFVPFLVPTRNLQIRRNKNNLFSYLFCPSRQQCIKLEKRPKDWFRYIRKYFNPSGQVAEQCHCEKLNAQCILVIDECNTCR